MKQPDASHPIAIAPAAGRRRASFAGRRLAESDRAWLLKEANYPEVVYFPREDSDMAALGRSPRSTRCPYKGEASYFSVMDSAGGSTGGENAVWSYEDPYPAVAEIRGCLAFYTDRVAVERV